MVSHRCGLKTQVLLYVGCGGRSHELGSQCHTKLKWKVKTEMKGWVWYAPGGSVYRYTVQEITLHFSGSWQISDSATQLQVHVSYFTYFLFAQCFSRYYYHRRHTFCIEIVSVSSRTSLFANFVCLSKYLLTFPRWSLVQCADANDATQWSHLNVFLKFFYNLYFMTTPAL